jgi:hypothetical protein
MIVNFEDQKQHFGHLCFLIFSLGIPRTPLYVTCIVEENYELRYGTLRQISRKQHFIVLAQTQQSCVQRLSPKKKGVSLASRLQRQKAKLNPLVAACDFTGYFIFPVLCDLHVSIL